MGIKAIKSIEKNVHNDPTLFDIANMIKVKQEPVTNHYKFLKKLGEGTYGEVFLAQQEKTNHNRAIKKINSLKYPRAKMMTLNEMSLLKALVLSNHNVRITPLFSKYMKYSNNQNTFT